MVVLHMDWSCIRTNCGATGIWDIDVMSCQIWEEFQTLHESFQIVQHLPKHLKLVQIIGMHSYSSMCEL